MEQLTHDGKFEGSNPTEHWDFLSKTYVGLLSYQYFKILFKGIQPKLSGPKFEELNPAAVDSGKVKVANTLGFVKLLYKKRVLVLNKLNSLPQIILHNT